MTQRAVVLVSGGLDSATVLAMALAQGFECLPLSIAYGQRHAVELEAARRVCRSLGVAEPQVVQIDLRAFGGSVLTADGEVPKSGLQPGIPVTYVPARNTIFLSYALAMAEVRGARDIFIGVNAVDYSGYPDCRPEFIAAFEALANLATRAGVQGERFRVQAPLSGLSKAEIIRRGSALGVEYGLTHSCYDPAGELACGLCDSCRIRARGFAEAGVPDPTRYVARGA